MATMETGNRWVSAHSSNLVPLTNETPQSANWYSTTVAKMNILAFGPHPDDVEFGCAPILMQEADRGHQVRILVATRGEASSSGTPEQREREARAAADVIGASIEFLDVNSDLGGDCHIQ